MDLEVWAFRVPLFFSLSYLGRSISMEERTSILKQLAESISLQRCIMPKILICKLSRNQRAPLFSRKRCSAFLGSERFLTGLKERFFPKKAHGQVPQSKELAPDRDTILGGVSEYYRVQREDLLHAKRGFFNEARNVTIYLTRMLRGDTLKEIGVGFGIDRYSTVSSVVER